MKKIAISISGIDAALAKRTLDALSGVVAADNEGGYVIAHCGDKLDSATLISALAEVGGRAVVVSEIIE